MLAAVLWLLVGSTSALAPLPKTTRLEGRLHASAVAPALAPSPAFSSPPLPRNKKSPVTTIQSEEDFELAMGHAEDELVVIKFFASWCRACKTIEPKFKRLANEFGGAARFYEIEFSANKDLCKRLEIKKLPCAQLYHRGHLETVVCGPSKFPQVRVAVERALGLDAHPEDVPEFTDISAHYEDE